VNIEYKTYKFVNMQWQYDNTMRKPAPMGRDPFWTTISINP
jgi:hypothetical protein